MYRAWQGLHTTEVCSVKIKPRNYEWGIKVLKEIVAIPTVNPPGENYKDFAYYSREVLNSMGFKTEVITVPGEYVSKYYPEYASHARYVVLGRIGEGKPIVHFNGHYDVVPAGSGWTTKPFEPVVVNEKIYGRGTNDMKGGIASFLTAVKNFLEVNKEFKGTIEVALVPDEEIGRYTGTGYVVEELKLRPDYVIIGEPSGTSTIWIGHKGAFWVLVEIYGKQVHGSTPWLGINAFEYMVKVADRILKEYKPVVEARISKYEYDDPRGARPTVNIGGEVRGSVKVNVVPGYYAFSIDRRVVPEEKLEDVEREFLDFMERVKRDYPEVRINVVVINRLPPAITDPSSQLVLLAKEAAREAIGVEPKTTVCLGGLDMRFYTEKNIQAITYGPGLIANAHVPDEYLPLDEFKKMSEVYHLLLEKLLKK